MGSVFEAFLHSVLPRSAISLPADPFYQLNAVKPYNKAYDITPVAVVRPSTTDEVAKVVKYATDNDVKVQARSGGHSYGDYSLGGKRATVMIDMVNFQQFSMDSTTGHAIIGSGTLLGDLTERLHNAGGRAIAHGTCPQVGIGGHATIGGLGPLSRLWGAALDHIIEAEVVLADGAVVRTNKDNRPEILFAVKGAAASFCVVTEFKVITHPEPAEMTNYSYTFSFGPHKPMANVFASWQNFVSQKDLTRKLASQLIVFEWGMVVQGTYFGPPSEFEALMFDEHLGKNATSKSVTLNHWLGTIAHWMEAEGVKVLGNVGAPFYAKSLAFREDTLIPANAIQPLFDLFDSSDKGTPLWFIIFDLEGGATNDIAMDATGFAHRDTLFYAQSYAIGILGVEPRTKQYLNDINNLIESSIPNGKLGAYPGYVDPFLKNGRELYWGSNYARLQRIKKELDPKDTFHNPQSVVTA